MGRNIFLFNDGTGQHLGSQNRSNIAKLFLALPGKEARHPHADSYKAEDAHGSHAFYIRGIGTEDLYAKEEASSNPQSICERIKLWLGRKLNITKELATGESIGQRIESSLKAIESLWQEGDKLYFFGFSRGAASVRLVASHLGRERKEISVEYMLIFDTVYSVLSEVQVRNEEKIKRFTDTEIGLHVKRCDHLIAGDEMRDMFPVTPVVLREGVRQILFAGSHSDVGGGNPSSALSDISLTFALDELNKFGIKFVEAQILNLKIAPDIRAKIVWDRFNGVGQTHFPRDLKKLSFLIHKSVFERSQANESVSIALAQLSTFKTSSSETLVPVATVETSFDFYKI